MLEKREIDQYLLQAALEWHLKMEITLATFRILGKTPFWKGLFINFAKGAETTSLICFITFADLLLGSARLSVLRSGTANYFQINSKGDGKCFIACI